MPQKCYWQAPRWDDRLLHQAKQSILWWTATATATATINNNNEDDEDGETSSCGND
jgi:hypothetical protein